jgi:hypothetical protein
LARSTSADHPARLKRLTAIKAAHTLAWFSIESCMLYVLCTGLKGRSGRRAAVAAAVVAGESLIFAANGFRCPLTSLAEQLGAERGSVTDIYLPRWFAHNLPAIHVALLLLAALLHRKNIAGCVRKLVSCAGRRVGPDAVWLVHIPAPLFLGRLVLAIQPTGAIMC